MIDKIKIEAKIEKIKENLKRAEKEALVLPYLERELQILRRNAIKC